jgi:hypothetical protein
VSPLYHYTCSCSVEGIRRDGYLRPYPHPLIERHPVPGEWSASTTRLVWLTDLEVAWREALGLTSKILKCDRTEHRFQAADESTAVPWTQFRRQVHAAVRSALEEAEGALPAHWFVSTVRVPVHTPVLHLSPEERNHRAR